MKAFVTSFSVATILLFATTPLRSYSLFIDFWISYTLYFLAFLFLLYTYNNKKVNVFIAGVGALMLWPLLAYIILGELPTVGLPNIAGIILSVCMAYCFSVRGKITRVVIILFSIAVCTLYGFVGGNYWFHYLNYRNFSGNVNEPIPGGAKVYNKTDTLIVGTLPERITVLDFWNTGCGICFKKFPVLEKFYKESAKKKNVAVMAINIPLSRDTAGMALRMITDKGYSFPVYVAMNGLDSLFQIESYPTTIILKNGRIIFRGNIEQAISLIEGL